LRNRLIGLPLLLLLAGCGSSYSAPAASGSGGNAVSLDAQSSQFMPATITAKAGDKITVTIHNKDGYEHNFSVSELSVSQDVEKGDTKSVTFTASGTTNLQFFCKYHKAKGMVGVLNLGGTNTPGAGASSAPATGNSAPAYGAY